MALWQPAPARVALIGYQDQGNLGMGYLAAVLQRHGYKAEMIDIRDGGAKIAARLLKRPPLVVGFSLIFQFFLPQFRRVAAHLRSVGITAHFTIGGHYPSLCHDELLTNFPEIDSVVRYEGEETLIELADRLKAGEDWRSISGIAYASNGQVVATPPRALVHDLDSLPFPLRPYGAERIAGTLDGWHAGSDVRAVPPVGRTVRGTVYGSCGPRSTKLPASSVRSRSSDSPVARRACATTCGIGRVPARRT
jgi:radical SAM superfamily enzyme YgiQ (UPF0313 family)